MVMKKGLSEIIGFFILLIILLVVLVPLAMLMFSQPSVQQQQQQNAQPYKNLAIQQYRDFEPIQLNTAGISIAPVYFIYDNSGSNAVYFVFPTNTSPPVPLTINYLMVYNGTTWVPQNVPSNDMEISPAYANAKYYGFPAIKIPLSVTPFNNQPSYVAAVTQYGNIIYASPPNVIPLLKVKGSVGIVKIDPYNIIIIQNPQFQPQTLTQPEPLMYFMGNLSSASPPTLTFYYGGYIGSSNGKPFTYDGSWFGPITPSSNNPGAPWFYGIANGTFINANFTLSGGFTGNIGNAKSYTLSNPIVYLTQGEAQYIIFYNTELNGSLTGIFNNVNITILGSSLNSLFSGNNYNSLYVTISSKATGTETYTYYLVNVSGTVTFIGKFVGTYNGQKVSMESTTLSGNINGTIKGVITSAKIYAGYTKTQGLLGNVKYLNGYIYVAGQVQMTVTFNGFYTPFGKYIGPIINGQVLSPHFDNTKAYPPSSTFTTTPFNITLNKFKGILTLTDQYANGVFNGNITFPTPAIPSVTIQAASFVGYLNGIFNGKYNYQLGSILNPTILSVRSSNATIGGVPVVTITPLVIKVYLAIYNPSNTTLEIDKIQATIEVVGILRFTGSGSSPVSTTLFGSSEETLIKPIIVPPLSNYSTSLYLIIPVTSLFTTSVIYNQVTSIQSFEPQYILLYLNFIEPSGYAIPVNALIPPYSIPVYGSS